jgi:clan AA aspartic protease
MGTFSVPFQVGDLAGQRFAQVEALVDTGSSDTSVPENVLADLGIEPIGEHPYRLADERIVRYPVGQARVRLDGQDLVVLDGQDLVVLVVFIPQGTMPLLGATTLETFGLGVDPKGKQLIPVPGLMKRESSI